MRFTPLKRGVNERKRPTIYACLYILLSGFIGNSRRLTAFTCSASQPGRYSVELVSPHMRSNRRQFLKTSAITTATAGLADLGFLSRLPRVSGAEAGAVAPNIVRFSPEIEPLVRLLEDTPREKLLEEVAMRIRHGLSYREVL